MSIYKRMAAILSELPAIGKGQWNEQQRFHFRGHDDVLNALNPLLAKHDVFVVPEVLDRVTGQRTTARGSIMFEVNLLVGYRFYGPDGDHVFASAWGEGTDVGDKATNKAMTMAFKNVLNQAFAISTSETVDSDGQTPEESIEKNEVVDQPAANQTTTSRTASSPSGSFSNSAATEAQKRLIKKLATKLSLDAGDLDALSKRDASAKIEELQKLEQMGADAVAVGGGAVDDIPF